MTIFVFSYMYINEYYKQKDKTSQEEKMKEKFDFRERLLKNGAGCLSDSELLAVLLRTGGAGQSVKKLARSVLCHVDRKSLEDIETGMRGVKGMGDTKIATVLAAFELGRRYYGFANMKIQHPSDIVKMVQHYAVRPQEQFVCVSLNGANEILATRVVTVGILNRSIVHPREVYAGPLTDRAASIIVCHNHPSGNTSPSQEDITLTQRLYDAGNILGIHLFDHLILTPSGTYYSFIENGISLSGR